MALVAIAIECLFSACIGHCGNFQCGRTEERSLRMSSASSFVGLVNHELLILSLGWQRLLACQAEVHSCRAFYLGVPDASICCPNTCAFATAKNSLTRQGSTGIGVSPGPWFCMLYRDAKHAVMLCDQWFLWTLGMWPSKVTVNTCVHAASLFSPP